MYKYGYRLRPPSLGTEPRGFIDKVALESKGQYWGYVFYDRKLSEGEMYAYDLDYIGKTD